MCVRLFNAPPTRRDSAERHKQTPSQTEPPVPHLTQKHRTSRNKRTTPYGQGLHHKQIPSHTEPPVRVRQATISNV